MSGRLVQKNDAFNFHIYSKTPETNFVVKKIHLEL